MRSNPPPDVECFYNISSLTQNYSKLDFKYLKKELKLVNKPKLHLNLKEPHLHTNACMHQQKVSNEMQ